jgi:hypothetical protein
MTIERPNTLARLVEKRVEIAGQISHTRPTLRQLIIDLDHVDAAIRIFDPNYDVGVSVRRSRQPHIVRCGAT